MSEHLTTKTIRIPISPRQSPYLLDDVRDAISAVAGAGEAPIRFAVTRSCADSWECELGIQSGGLATDSIFRFGRTKHPNLTAFNSVMLVPTGIGAEIGGHAGDAAPAASLISSVCDSMITHPNVLNASDLIQIPSNALYVEGSIITRMLLGTDRLLPVRSNRVLVLIQSMKISYSPRPQLTLSMQRGRTTD